LECGGLPLLSRSTTHRKSNPRRSRVTSFNLGRKTAFGRHPACPDIRREEHSKPAENALQRRRDEDSERFLARQRSAFFWSAAARRRVRGLQHIANQTRGEAASQVSISAAKPSLAVIQRSAATKDLSSIETLEETLKGFSAGNLPKH